MVFVASLSLFSPSLRSDFQSQSSPKFWSISRLALENTRSSLRTLCSLTFPTTEQDILKFAVESDGKSLPCVRTYENDLARLSLVGAVGFNQALTAAASDGGKAAAEHLRDGVPVMVVDTVYPGGSDPQATVSTRLFLLAEKVRERAKKLRRSFAEDIFAGNTSENILAMTFRQVVLQRLWSFQLVLFRPGTQRDLDDLENPRQDPTFFALSSSNESVIAVIAEVICISVLQSTERHFLDDYLGRAPFSFFQWFRKHRRIASRDSSVVLYKLFDEELVENARQLLEYFHSMKDTFKPSQTRRMKDWWKLPVSSELEKIGGTGFSDWATEYVPAYRLAIDPTELGEVKFEGWRKSTGNRWEVLLTHSQMVGLSETLDMYFEDIYSLPKKHLPCGSVANYADLSIKKGGLSLLKFASIAAASGILLIAISIVGQFCFPHQSKAGKSLGEPQPIQSSKIEPLSPRYLGTSEVDSFCTLVVKKLKDAFCWPGDIITESGTGAWIGELPDYLKKIGGDKKTSPSHIKNMDEDTKSSVQDVASYQVVLSTEGKVIGFQPTSRVGVNHWASNPLAKELYGGKKLSPGLIEPSLKSRRPDEVIVIELLMSENSDSPFALARPILEL